MCSPHRRKIESELQSLIQRLGVSAWRFSPEQLDSQRADEAYRRRLESHVCSQEYREWEEQHSCDYTIVGNHFAKHLGNIHWNSIERFFNLVEWGGSPPDYAKSFGSSCFAQRGGIRIEWSDHYELIDKPGRFIVIPTASLFERGVETKLTAYEEQCNQPARLQFKEIDIANYCRNRAHPHGCIAHVLEGD